MVSIVKRDTTTNIVGSIQNDLNVVTGTGATLTYNALAATRIWGSMATGSSDWTGGTYTWRYRVVTANSTITITQVRLIRYASDGTTIRASKSSGAISISCSTTGVKSGTIDWNDGTQNPSDRTASDRFAIEFTTASSGHGTQNIGVGTNLGSVNDEIDTPLTFAQNFNGNITESSISVDETLSRIQALIKSINESSLSVNDSVTGDFTPSGPAVINYIVSIVEFPEIVLDAVNVLENINIIERSIEDSAVNINDSIIRTINTFRLIQETTTINQTISVLLSSVRSISQNTPIEEVLARIYAASRPISESAISINDTVARAISILYTLQESVSINQTIARTLAATRSMPESETINDTVEDIYGTIGSITEDSININQTLSRILSATRSASDDTDIEDIIQGIIVILRSLEETVTVNQTLNRVLGAVRSLEETTNINDSLNRIQNIIKSISQTVGVSDSVTGIIVIIRSINEAAINTNDTINLLLQAIRNPTESTNINDTVTKSVNYIKTISENAVTIADLVSKLILQLRTLSEEYQVSDTLNRRIDVTKSIEEIITVQDALQKAFGHSETINENLISTTDSVATLLAAIRDIIVSVSVAELLSRSQSVTKNINDNVNLSETILGRLIKLGGQIKLAGGIPDKSDTEIIALVINFIKANWSNQA